VEGPHDVNLYEKYGGFSAVSKIVMSFYNRVLDSDQVGDYFENIDMKNLIDHQTKFVASVMGGPASFSDDMLHRVHARLEIDQEDFDEVARLMRESLIEHGLDEHDVDSIMLTINSKSPLIVIRPDAD
jgi:hemoglobin